MSNWASLLVKTSLSPWLVEECCSHASAELKAALSVQLGGLVDSPTALKNLKAAAKGLRAVLPPALVQELNEEVGEIAADAKWAMTGRGRYVLAINQWIEPFHAEFRSRGEFNKVVLGGHGAREVVFATGFVPSEEIFLELMTFIQSKSPPFKVMTDVRIGAWNGPKATA